MIYGQEKTILRRIFTPSVLLTLRLYDFKSFNQAHYQCKNLVIAGKHYSNLEI
jgi:hypothetical protein